MTKLEVKTGLRKLHFAPVKSGDSSRRHVVVHFAVAERLPIDQEVSVNLGLHAGVVRILHGRPKLLEFESSGAGRKPLKSFVYVLEGEVD
jgi:hypothetical protein